MTSGCDVHGDYFDGCRDCLLEWLNRPAPPRPDPVLELVPAPRHGIDCPCSKCGGLLS